MTLPSKFSNFIFNALNRQSDLEVKVSSDNYLNQQSQKTILSLKHNINFKILSSGLFIISSLLNPSAYGQTYNVNVLEKASFQNEAQATVDKSIEMGFIHGKVNTYIHTVNENVSDDFFKLQSFSEKDNSSHNRLNGECDVNVSYSQDGRTVFMGFTDGAEDVSAPKTLSQKALLREEVLLHEVSHCEFSKIKNPILVHGDDKLQKDMNYFFRRGDSDDSEKISAIAPTLNETFADTYSLIQVIKIHGINEDTRWLLKSINLQRMEDSLVQGSYDKLESHSTQYAIQTLMQPDIQKVIFETDNPEALKSLALDIANQSVQKLYVTYDDRSTRAYGLEVLKDAMENTLMNYLCSNRSDAATSHNPFFKNSEEHTFAQDTLPLMLKYVQEHHVSASDLQPTIEHNGYLAQGQVAQVLIQATEQAFNQTVTKEMQSRILDTESAYTDYIKNSVKKNNADFMNSNSTNIQLAQRLVGLREEFIHDDTNLVVVANPNTFQSAQKQTVVRKINIMRSEVPTAVVPPALKK